MGVGADLFPADLVYIGRMGLWACGASFAGDAPRLYGGFRRAASRISPSLQTTLPMRLLAFILRLMAPWTWFGWKVASEPVPAPVDLKPFEIHRLQRRWLSRLHRYRPGQLPFLNRFSAESDAAAGRAGLARSRGSRWTASAGASEPTTSPIAITVRKRLRGR